MDKDTEIAVDMEIEHIKEIYGREGLILAMELLKKIMSDPEIKYHSMEEICEGCVHGNWHRCCDSDSFCYCGGEAEDEDIDRYSGTCKLKE